MLLAQHSRRNVILTLIILTFVAAPWNLTAADETTYQGSCLNYCGKQWHTRHYDPNAPAEFPYLERIPLDTTFHDGCSCAADCWYYGNCCSDIEEHCGSPTYDIPGYQFTKPVTISSRLNELGSSEEHHCGS